VTTGRPVVFVVDDQEANVRLLEQILDRADLADTRSFADARVALAAVTEEVPDLILLDLHMPHLDGFGFLAALGARMADDDFLPVLVVTADVDRETRRRALRAGANDFLTKPIDADEVVARCQNLLRTRSLHLTLRQRNWGLKGELDERTSTLQRVRRERDEIVSSIAGLEPLDTIEATARRICSELVRVGRVDAAAVVQLTPEGNAVPLASDGLRIDASSDLRTMPEELTRSLRRQAQSGPWVEERIAPGMDKPFRAQLILAGAVSAIYAPMRVAGGVVGVVVGMTGDERSAEELVEHLPAVVEYAAVAGAVIGPQLASGVDRAHARREIEAIIEQQALRIVFQPVVGLARSEVVGFEALTRFEDGMPSDRRFREADAVGLGAALELACLRQALGLAEHLPNDCWLSLNVSPALILAGDALHTILAGTDRPLVLEVTEHSPVDDYQELRHAIGRLGPRVRLAMDDAGAGFASFRHILELRPDFVKLDIGLVRAIDSDPARQALVAGMEYFAARTKCTLIAEGVETGNERRAISQLGVPLGQGYLLGRPGPIEVWLEGQRSRRPSASTRRLMATPATLSRTRG
jgi:EAL domain-containing protein (putative c-di-GMP-specific phosphodiesterase class I)/CheY-like chemotaxis protein